MKPLNSLRLAVLVAGPAAAAAADSPPPSTSGESFRFDLSFTARAAELVERVGIRPWEPSFDAIEAGRGWETGIRPIDIVLPQAVPRGIRGEPLSAALVDGGGACGECEACFRRCDPLTSQDQLMVWAMCIAGCATRPGICDVADCLPDSKKQIEIGVDVSTAGLSLLHNQKILEVDLYASYEETTRAFETTGVKAKDLATFRLSNGRASSIAALTSQAECTQCQTALQNCVQYAWNLSAWTGCATAVTDSGICNDCPKVDKKNFH